MRRHIQHLKHAGILTRRKFFALAACVNLAFLAIIVLNALSFPNTYIGRKNLGLQTRDGIRTYVNATYATPIQLTINDQTYDLTWEHLGIYVDSDAIIAEIFQPNASRSFATVFGFLRQVFVPRRIHAPLIFSQEFSEYLDKLDAAGREGSDVVYIDQQQKLATLIIPKQRYVVDRASLHMVLTERFGNTDTPIIVPLQEAPSELEETVSSSNTKLLRAYGDPLTIIVGVSGTNHFLTLSSEDLKRYTTTRLINGSQEVSFDINRATFLPDVTTALSAYQLTFNSETAADRIGNGITNALTTRFQGGIADSVKVGIDSGPNTDGEIAVRYIEVDISQQKLFTFKNGRLVKTYRVSTGKDYPTPTGTFKIINKTGLGFSKIYNVWLPYWMAFEYSKELRAYFGIHELPYYYSGTNKIQRPREFIGAPNTGGCVALDIGDAKEVYQFADIGTTVMIYQ